MAKFTVEVERSVRYAMSVTVEADNAEDARKAATKAAMPETIAGWRVCYYADPFSSRLAHKCIEAGSN